MIRRANHVRTLNFMVHIRISTMYLRKNITSKHIFILFWQPALLAINITMTFLLRTALSRTSQHKLNTLILTANKHTITSSSLVPVVLESGAGGERSFDIYSRLLRERIICVHGAVTDAMASVVTAQLLFLESEAPDKPLSMYINSPGGVVTAGMAIYDTMQYVSPDVHTICLGQAASMGSLLLAGGSPGCRSAL